MNKYILAFTASLVACTTPILAKDSLIDSVELLSSTNVSLEEKAECDTAFKAQEKAGIKFSIKNGGAALFLDAKTEHEPTWAYGIRYRLAFPSFCAETHAGNLRYSQAMGRLKNPVPTIPSLIGRPGCLSSLAHPSLPAGAASPAMQSASLTLSPTKRSLIPTIQCGIFENLDFFFGAAETLSFRSVPYLNVSVFGGMFTYGKEKKGAYFTTGMKKRARPAIQADCSLEIPHLSMSAAGALYEGPSAPTFWVRNTDTLEAGDFMLKATWYWSSKDLITTGCSSPSTFFLANINPQYNFYIGGKTLKTALLAQTDIREDDTRYTFKAEASLYAWSAKINAAASWAFTDALEKQSVSASASATFPIAPIKASVSVSAAANEREQSYKARASVSFPRMILKDAGVSVQTKLKDDNDITTKLEAGLALRGRVKRFAWSGKIMFTMSFD